jgi:hypothetical protein
MEENISFDKNYIFRTNDRPFKEKSESVQQ